MPNTNLNALIINCTLKKSPEPSNMDALISEVIKHFDEEGVSSKTIRLVDYNVAHTC